MGKKKTAKDKEEGSMATISKYRQSTIIKKSKTKDFFDLLQKHSANADYWSNCAKPEKGISSKAMDRIKKLCGNSSDE